MALRFIFLQNILKSHNEIYFLARGKALVRGIFKEFTSLKRREW